MPTFEQSTDIHISADRLFAYLADINNLPKYFEGLTGVEQAHGEKIRTTAYVDVDEDGEPEEIQGEAWFRVSESEKRLQWGSEGESDYHGELEVSGNGSASTVSVTIHTVKDDDPDIDKGIQGTLANIKRLVEAS